MGISLLIILTAFYIEQYAPSNDAQICYICKKL